MTRERRICFALKHTTIAATPHAYLPYYKIIIYLNLHLTLSFLIIKNWICSTKLSLLVVLCWLSWKSFYWVFCCCCALLCFIHGAVMGINNAQMHLIWTFQLLSDIFLPHCFGWQVKIMMMNRMVTKLVIYLISKTTVSHPPLHISLSDLKMNLFLFSYHPWEKLMKATIFGWYFFLMSSNIAKS